MFRTIKKDKALLEQIQSYFGKGNIVKNRSESLKYSARSVEDLKTIINHPPSGVDNYPVRFLSQSLRDFNYKKTSF